MLTCVLSQQAMSGTSMHGSSWCACHHVQVPAHTHMSTVQRCSHECAFMSLNMSTAVCPPTQAKEQCKNLKNDPVALMRTLSESLNSLEHLNRQLVQVLFSAGHTLCIIEAYSAVYCKTAAATQLNIRVSLSYASGGVHCCREPAVVSQQSHYRTLDST